LANSEADVIVPKSRHSDWLAREELVSLTPDQIVERVRGVGDIIAAEAGEAERQRHATEVAWSALRKTGVFYLYVPKEHGGIGATSFTTLVDVVPLIAENCASTGWCAVQCLFHQWLVGLCSSDLQREIWSAFPYLTAASSAFPPGRAVRTEGGYRLTGDYRWGTGVMYAQWVIAFATIEASEKPEAYCFFVPVDQATVLDTWRTDGMVGTGSHDYQLRDVFVPEHRAANVATLGGTAQPIGSPLNRVPFVVFSALPACLPILGAARSVVKGYRTRLSSSGPNRGPSDRALDHVRLARADLAVTTAERVIRDTVAQMEQLSSRPSPMTELEKAELRAQFAYASSLCRDAVRIISDASGSSAHALSNPLQRAVRDINMLSTHAAIELDTHLESLGRVQLGLSPSRKSILQTGLGG
jgi:alkylation response protein AidB-like acyl-CoA dehydrogenase